MGLKKAIRAMRITFFISSFIKIHMSQELGISRSSRSLTFFYLVVAIVESKGSMSLVVLE